MSSQFQARRITKHRADEVKKKGAPRQAMLLDTFNGIIVIEPREFTIGDGELLSPEEADYELQPVWHLGPKTVLREARKRLGLDGEAAVRALAGASA
jgi:hypothetical protein